MTPRIEVREAIAGESAWITVRNVSAVATRVFIGFSLRESCRDVSDQFGPGARLGPALVDVPTAIPPFRPILDLGLDVPTIDFQRRIPSHWANRRIHLQAFVEDPWAEGGYAFSDSISVTVQRSEDGGDSFLMTGFMTLPTPRSHMSIQSDPSTADIFCFGPEIVEVDPTKPAYGAVRVSRDKFPTPRVSVSTVRDPQTGLIYVLGGSHPVSRQRTDEILVFDTSYAAGGRVFPLADRLPEARSGSTAVWDPIRRVAYLFGGLNSSGRSTRDIYRFDPRAAPGQKVTVISDRLAAAVESMAAVYHPARDVVFLAGSGSAEILEFDPDMPDGSKLRVVDQLPSARNSVGGTYDPQYGTIFFVGGATSSGQYLDEIVEFNPSAPPGARVRVAAQMPSGRSAVAVVKDPTSDRILIFGGYSQTTGLIDRIVEFRPPSYTRSLGGFQFGSQLAGAVLDPRTNHSYVFDKVIYRVDSRGRFGDEVAVIAERFFPVRQAAATVWDPVHNVAYVFGGLEDGIWRRLDDAYRFDPSRPEGTRLEKLSDRLPYGVSGAAAVWDSSRQVAYLIGGSLEGGRPTRQIIRFNPQASSGSRFTIIQDQLPQAASSLASAYDQVTDTVFLFGNGTTSIVGMRPGMPVGQQISIIGDLPEVRDGMAASIDHTRGLIYLFGGRQPSGFHSNEILEFDPMMPISEALRQVGTLPKERAYSTALYYASSDQFFVFGGVGTEDEVRIFGN